MSRWTDESLRRLREVGHLTPAEVRSAVGDDPVVWETFLMAALPVAAEFARPPVSDFFVGAAVYSQVDPEAGAPALTLGANLEFTGQALTTAVHAEQAAAARAWARGARGLRAVATTAAPCGHCRQFLAELGRDENLRMIVPGEDTVDLTTLLPESFGPASLGRDEGWMAKGIAPVPSIGSASDDELEARAQQAAATSYAPYSGVPAGLALRMQDGRSVVGRLIENAAFNPSLLPLPSALVELAFLSPAVEWTQIDAVVLAEGEGASSVRQATETLLASIAATASLRCLPLRAQG
jgi:cytidine deaminase